MPPKSQAEPFAYSKLLVRTLPTFAVLVTDKLLDTSIKLAIARLPKLALLNCELPTTVNRFVVWLNVKLALAPKLVLPSLN